jgi:hypothetical protein
VDARADHGSTFYHGRQRRRDEWTDGSEDHGGVEWFRWDGLGVAGPRDAQLARQRLRVVVAAACEREHASAFLARDLRHQVGRGAESVQPEPGGVAGTPQRPIADEARAQ